MAKKKTATKKVSKKEDPKLKKIMIFLFILGIVVFIATMIYYLLKKDSSGEECCSDPDNSSFIPIATAVWVPIMAAAANKKKGKMTDKETKLIRILTIFISLMLIIGIVVFAINVL